MNRTIFFVLLLVLAGCTPLVSEKYTEKPERSGGLPYHLPKSIMAIEVKTIRDENNNVTDLSLHVEPKTIPDSNAVYYLDSRRNWWFSSDHKIAVTNGLLSSINTKDTGEAGDVVASVVNSAIELYKASQGFVDIPSAQSATKDPFLVAGGDPTRAEILKAFSMVQGDTIGAHFQVASSATDIELPGTNSLLYVGADCKVATTVPSVASGVAAPPAPNIHKGIFVRTLREQEISVALCMNKRVLKDVRLAAFQKALTAQDRTVTTQTANESRKRLEQAQKCSNEEQNKESKRRNLSLINSLSELKLDESYAERLESIESRIVDVEKANEELGKAIAACLSAKSATITAQQSLRSAKQAKTKLMGDQAKVIADNETAHFVIYKHSDVVLVVDEAKTLTVPVYRAFIGETTNDLTLKDGILTDSHSIRPSVAGEVGRTLEKISKAISSFVAQIIPFKIEYTNKQTELLKKQAELEQEVNKLKTVSDVNLALEQEIQALEDKEELTPTEQARLDVAKLQQEKNLLTLQKDIATLQSEIAALQKAIDDAKTDTETSSGDVSEDEEGLTF